jgi:kynurenine formamidase
MIYDLTHPLSAGMDVWPGDIDVDFELIKLHVEDGYCSHRISMGTHTGTHMDSPYHRAPFGERIDSFEMLARAAGDALVIDVSQFIRNNVIDFDRSAGFMAAIRRDMRVLLATGWSRFWGEEKYYRDYPSISKELAFLLVECGIALIGVDTPSVDRPDEDTIHDVFLPAGIPIIENLNNLHTLGNGNVFFSAVPLRLTDLDGSPVRAYAIK